MGWEGWSVGKCREETMSAGNSFPLIPQWLCCTLVYEIYVYIGASHMCICLHNGWRAEQVLVVQLYSDL